MSGRPGEEYRVRARIEGRSGRRRWLVPLAALVVIAGWLGITANAPRTGPPPRTGAPASMDPGVFVRPSDPPAVDIRLPSEPMGRVPLVVGGLGWLDPARGTFQRADLAGFAQWVFALPEGGTACVCVEIAAEGAAADLHLFRYDRDGTLGGADTIPAWLPGGDAPVIGDAILEPDGSGVIVAAAVQGAVSWHLRLLDLRFGGLGAGSTSESDLDLSTLGDPRRLDLRLAVSPNGDRLRIGVRHVSGPFDPQPPTGLTWVADRRSGRWSAPRAVAASRDGGLLCGPAAWATATDVVSICLSQTPDDNGQLSSFIEIERADGRIELTDVGTAAFQEEDGWLVDATHGVVYGWTSLSHQLYRFDVASGHLARRSFFNAEGPAGSLRNTGAEATPPPAGATTVLWQPMGSAAQVSASPLVGSPDGTLLYAMGIEFPEGQVGFGGPASTGIWVFDAAALAIVGHWQPAITYQAIGLAAGGHLLVGVGSASAEEQSAFGNHGPQLVVHRTSDGAVIAIDRGLVLQLGGVPFLLPAGPGP